MKSLTSFLILLSFIPQSSVAAIYGSDGRRDAFLAPELRSVFSAVAIMVGTALISKNSDGTSMVDMADKVSDYVCSKERFAKQSSLGLCTGFLISDRHLVTAGHCGVPNEVSSDPNHAFCGPELTWYFGYELDKPSAQPHLKIQDDQLYRCKKLLRIENTMRAGGIENNDFAIIELDRPVKGATPLKISEKSVRKHDTVYTVGFPMGMPAKSSDRSRVLDNSHAIYFSVNLDTQSGNSGGPVLNNKNEVVGILISGHNYDLYKDARQSCERYNRCDQSGKNCNKNAEPGKIGQISNHVQRIEFVRPYIETAH